MKSNRQQCKNHQHLNCRNINLNRRSWKGTCPHPIATYIICLSLLWVLFDLVEGTGSNNTINVNIQQLSQTENLKSFTMKNVRMLTLEENAKIEMQTFFTVAETNLHTLVLDHY